MRTSDPNRSVFLPGRGTYSRCRRRVTKRIRVILKDEAARVSRQLSEEVPNASEAPPTFFPPPPTAQETRQQEEVT